MVMETWAFDMQHVWAGVDMFIGKQAHQ